jgi:hypothetical protein
VTTNEEIRQQLLKHGPPGTKKHLKKRTSGTKNTDKTSTSIKVSSTPILTQEIGEKDYTTEEIQEQQEEQPVAFKPNPGPQTNFLAAPELQVLYGGSAGGGKSYAMLADPIRYVANKKFSGLLVRNTTEELRELIRESKQLYPQVFQKAKWSERDKTWTFPSGAQLWMSYLEKDDDVLRYRGQAFSWIGFDELTQWPTPYAWNYMSSRLRTTDPSLPLSQRATTNPGGPGHWWVKKMFIDPAPWGKSFWATDIETGEVLTDPEEESENFNKPLFKRRFIPATLKDNPYLTRDDNYRRQLLAMPEHQRKQLLYGDWDVAEGAAFTEWNRDVHTCDPFDIPKSWMRFRACDYGYGSYSAVLWFAIEPKTETIYVYRELYVSKVLAIDLARMVLRMEQEDGGIKYGVLDSSLWNKRGDTGPSLAEQMISVGCRWRPSDRSKGSRIAGKNEIHRRLQVDEFTEKPRLIFFNTCVNSISQLPQIPLDKNNPEDVDTNYAHDHIYDALRYGIMSRPRSTVWSFEEFGMQPDTYNVSDEVFGY